MQSLDLSYNQLSFNLPEALANVGLLETLKLQKNHFTGKIPNGFLKLRKLKELGLGLRAPTLETKVYVGSLLLPVIM